MDLTEYGGKPRFFTCYESKNRHYLYTYIENARTQAYKAVNFAIVQAYWNIGRLIVEEEQNGEAKSGYGKSLIKELSKKLTRDFGKGFTVTNLNYMRQFYLSFPIDHALRDQSNVNTFLTER